MTNKIRYSTTEDILYVRLENSTFGAVSVAGDCTSQYDIESN
jgi:hypothetical protein